VFVNDICAVYYILIYCLRIRKVIKMKKNILILIWLLTAVFCFGQSNFTRGEELFMQNNPAQASIFLENAVADDPAHVLAWLYLGISYEQLNRSDEAIAAYRRILPIAGNLSANIANNLGNVYFHRGNTEMAEQYYTQAIGFDSVYSRAYLGRANTRIKAGNLRNAITDYEQYLTLEPRSSQRARIEQLVSLIRAEFAAEERQRILAEEEARRVAEEREKQRIIAEEERERQRIAAEEERERQRVIAEEEARRLAEERQRILDAVSASLSSAADYSQGISSGAESVEGYDGEFILD